MIRLNSLLRKKHSGDETDKIDKKKNETSGMNAAPEVTCAECKIKFSWQDAFYQQDTPESAPFHPAGHGDTRPRVFCSNCGALVVDWHITREKDFEEWTWFGQNGAINANSPLPPSPFSHSGMKGIPIECKSPYSKHTVDIQRITQFYKDMDARRRDVIERETVSQGAEGIDWSKVQNYYAFGHSLKLKGDLKNAEKAFHLSIETNPGNMAAYNGLGLLLQRQERYDEAIAVFEKAMKADPDNLISNNNLFRLYLRLNNYESAEDVYKKTMKIAPGHPIPEGMRKELENKKSNG